MPGCRALVVPLLLAWPSESVPDAIRRLVGARGRNPKSGDLTRTPPATFGFFSNRPSSRSKGGAGFKSGSKRVLAMRFQEVPSGSQLSVWKGLKNATKVFKGKVVSIRTGQIARKTHVEVMCMRVLKGSGNGLGPLGASIEQQAKRTLSHARSFGIHFN